MAEFSTNTSECDFSPKSKSGAGITYADVMLACRPDPKKIFGLQSPAIADETTTRPDNSIPPTFPNPFQLKSEGAIKIKSQTDASKKYKIPDSNSLPAQSFKNERAESDLETQFRKEFPTELASEFGASQKTNTRIGAFLHKNFDALHEVGHRSAYSLLDNLIDTTDQSYKRWQPTSPRTITYEGLQELRALTDPSRKYDNYYQGMLGDAKSDLRLWGTFAGAMIGGTASTFVPLMKGNVGGLTLAMLAGGAIGMIVADKLNRELPPPPQVTYLEREKAEYRSYLGNIYSSNTLIGGAGLIGTATALTWLVPGTRAITPLFAAGIGTALLGPLVANGVGRIVANRRMEHKLELSQKLLEEWNSKELSKDLDK